MATSRRPLGQTPCSKEPERSCPGQSLADSRAATAITFFRLQPLGLPTESLWFRGDESLLSFTLGVSAARRHGGKPKTLAAE